MKLSILFIFLSFSSTIVQAQTSSLGIGTGLSYGGAGVRAAHYPTDHFGVFGGLGYYWTGLGYHAGVQVLLPSEKNTKLFFQAGYGLLDRVNLKRNVQAIDGYNLKKGYNGFSLGAGVNISNKKGDYWHLALMIPFRSDEFFDDLDDFEEANNGVGYRGLERPLKLTIGYNFSL